MHGAEKCWFQYNETEYQENNQNQNSEITSKLFDMMETFTNRNENGKPNGNVKPIKKGEM